MPTFEPSLTTHFGIEVYIWTFILGVTVYLFFKAVIEFLKLPWRKIIWRVERRI